MGLLSLRFGLLLVQSHVASPPLLINPSPYSVNRKTPARPHEFPEPAQGGICTARPLRFCSRWGPAPPKKYADTMGASIELTAPSAPPRQFWRIGRVQM